MINLLNWKPSTLQCYEFQPSAFSGLNRFSRRCLPRIMDTVLKINRNLGLIFFNTKVWINNFQESDGTLVTQRPMYSWLTILADPFFVKGTSEQSRQRFDHANICSGNAHDQSIGEALFSAPGRTGSQMDTTFSIKKTRKISLLRFLNVGHFRFIKRLRFLQTQLAGHAPDFLSRSARQILKEVFYPSIGPFLSQYIFFALCPKCILISRRPVELHPMAHAANRIMTPPRKMHLKGLIHHCLIKIFQNFNFFWRPRFLNMTHALIVYKQKQFVKGKTPCPTP